MSENRGAETCTGAHDCTATRHVHGCYADMGACDAPDEHRRVYSTRGGVVLWRCPWVTKGERCPLPMGHGGERHV